MNTVNIIGRLTKDIELKKTTTGKSVCSFCIAVDGGKDTTYFIDCTAWNATAERISSTVHKGDKIAISGMLTTRSWETQDGQARKVTEVMAMNFDYCSTKKTADSPQDQAPAPTSAPEPSGTLPFELD